jgi:8-oxo-dGTP pyrophosphatase MutT (NUDIX family)
MYKIYIEEVPVLLVQNITDIEITAETKVLHYPQDKKMFLTEIEQLEENKIAYQQLVVVAKEGKLKKLKKKFFKPYKVVKAGGGVVFNAKDEILAIFRRGHWDLPKGKREKGESMATTAIREVQEETGIENIVLGDLIMETFHTFYNRKGKRCIKRSYWYRMETEDVELSPQLEEDIEQAVWIDKETLLGKRPIYKNIVDVLNQL